ncbi:YtxH domain-containing protein [Mobilicoccus pelagius]|uniref:YtxH domain-containing protein n=1 Tax=Mobilicoccus pelagius NBRC 104925 TaxID=1089455 RepID=H5UW55_9MICO|nr:YtxH domain-containing protein [Mobilicoccus pelagius]GAB49963.1 hypothetical protein MOPEL_135_02010 [Mobilicoccus pelagius NBRC 104925]
MKLKLTFLAGAAAGYVLGTRAGRDRYDDMKKQADALWHDPRVQEKVSVATETVKEKAPDVGAKISSAAGSAASTVKDKVSDAAGDEGEGEGGAMIGQEKGSDYTPRETKVQSK